MINKTTDEDGGVGFKKFNQQSGGDYWENYFRRDKEFYDTIKKHMSKYIPRRDTRGLDIGAGPGVGARLLVDLGFATRLTGLEPSQTHLDGKRLSEELLSQKSSVEYHVENGGIADVDVYSRAVFDYILILRASHEIGESLGSKESFFSELSRIPQSLKKPGFLIIAEPQYSEDINPEEVVKKVQKYQLENIGHCHVPDDYINAREMRIQIEKLGLQLKEETILPNGKLLDYLRSEEMSIEESPCSFYVQTFMKQ